MSAAGGLHAQGKVRDIFDAGPDALLLVASDRISAFDVILPDPVPDKGRVLTAFSLFWFERTRDLVANHVITANRWEFPEPFAHETFLSGRAMLVRRAEVIPVECVARGYLSGSGWKDYVRSGSVCGQALPAGLVESARSARADLHADNQGGRGPRPPAHAGGDRRADRAWARRAAEGAHAHGVRAHRRRCPGTRRHPGRHQVRVRVLRRRADPHRRGRHARLLALLAGRSVRPGRPPAELRQAVRAGLARHERVGP